MLDELFGKKEKKEEKKQQAEADKEREFIQKRDTFAAGMNDDETFLAQKEARSDLTKWQQDLEDSIKQLEYDLLNYVHTDEGWGPELELKGYKLDEKGKCILGKDGNPIGVYGPRKPMVNRTGTYRIIALVRRYLSRNTMMSNLKEELILRMLRRLKTNLVINLGAKYKEYEIDLQDLSIICELIMDSVEFTLYRAFNNGERVHLNTINKRIESFSEMPQAQGKKGLMGLI